MSLSAETQLNNDYNHLNELIEQGIPLVLFDRVTDTVACDKVLINDKDGAYRAVKKLLSNGRKRIALIATEDYLSVSKDRTTGYLQALKESNIEIDEDLILKLPSMSSVEGAEMETFFKSQQVDAVLCVNEIYAIHGMRIAQKMGYKIPEDISFIGFTDGILSKFSNPTLTSVAQHGEKMGEIAAEMLIEKVESENDVETFRTEILAPTIVERESTEN